MVVLWRVLNPLGITGEITDSGRFPHAAGVRSAGGEMVRVLPSQEGCWDDDESWPIPHSKTFQIQVLVCADADFLGTLEKEEHGIHLDVSLTWCSGARISCITGGLPLMFFLLDTALVLNLHDISFTCLRKPKEISSIHATYLPSCSTPAMVSILAL